MKLGAAFTATMAAVFSGAALAANIDNGFALDGATTYCMGEKGTPGTLMFDSLEASNVGRCPVGVTLALTASKFNVNAPITIKWKATTNQGVTNSIFPNAIDAATKLPHAVTTSKLSACTVGTNCAKNVPGTPTGADGASTGDFAPDGTKALETNTLKLATPGDYIIVGLVALPGDSSLNIAAEEYLVFKKISVVSEDTAISPTTGSLDAALSALNSNNLTSNMADDKSNVMSNSAEKTTALPSDQTEKGSSKSASTSSGSDGIGGNGVAIIAAVVGCCIVGVVGFIFVIRRRKQKRTNANKAFDVDSPSMASDVDDSSPSDDNGCKIDLTYIANVTARNNGMNAADNMMSEESSVAIMSSAARGSELNSSNGNSLHSLPQSSLDTDEYSDKASYGAAGATGHKAEYDAYHMSNMPTLLPSANGTQSEASMSNFGDSIVSARQKKYLQPGDWNNSVSSSSRMDSCLDSVEQAELKARGFGSIGGLSAVSGLSEDETSRIASEHGSELDIGFSMSSRPTEDSRATVESRFTAEYRATEDLRVSEDSQAAGFSEAMHQSRMSAVDLYGFRASRSSADSYSSGMSSFSREGSRISGFSVASSVGSPNGSSKY